MNLYTTTQNCPSHYEINFLHFSFNFQFHGLGLVKIWSLCHWIRRNEIFISIFFICIQINVDQVNGGGCLAHFNIVANAENARFNHSDVCNTLFAATRWNRFALKQGIIEIGHRFIDQCAIIVEFYAHIYTFIVFVGLAIVKTCKCHGFS